MGVKGLWDVLQPAAEAVPLTQLSLNAFKENKDGYRALRIGIDASLWVFHAKSVPQNGLNPFLRTIFFKTLKLLQYPVLLLFVFDGPYKPAMKRGNKVGGRFGRGDRESQQFKLLLDEMGLEYWDAPGEAEAELAQINRAGLIDAVLTDDVDALVFGATCVLRNPSRGLSGNASNLSSQLPLSESREDYQVYRKEEIENADLRKNKTGDEDFVAMDADGMILLALLVGGDYHPAGMPSCGPKIAMGLVQAGLGKELLQAYRNLTLQEFETYLTSFIETLREELATNAHGFLPGRRKALASKIPPDFPSREVLEYYAKPKVSLAEEAWPGFGKRIRGTTGAGFRGGRGDPRAWARACERFFEWGSKEEVGKRFRTLVWRGEIIQAVRQKLGAPTGDEDVSPGGEASEGARVSGSSPPLPKARSKTKNINSYFVTQSRASGSTARARSPLAGRYTFSFPEPEMKDIHGKRVHIVTGHTAEYRVEFDPSEWNRLIQDSMDGTRLQSSELTAEERQALDMVSVPATGNSTSEHESSSALSDEDTSNAVTPKKARQRKQVDLNSSDKVWIPVDFIKLGFPELEEQYEQKLREKEEASKTPRKRAAKASTQISAKSPKKPAKSKAATSSQQSTVTGWFDSSKPPSHMKTPQKKGMASKTRASQQETAPIEIIDLSDSPDPEPTRVTRASSIGSSVIALGSSIIELDTSSPVSSRKAGKRADTFLSRPSNTVLNSDTSDGDESTDADTPEWLRKLTKSRPRPDSPDVTPKIRTRAKSRNIVSSPMAIDTPPRKRTPTREIEAQKEMASVATFEKEAEEYELTPVAVKRSARLATRNLNPGDVPVFEPEPSVFSDTNSMASLSRAVSEDTASHSDKEYVPVRPSMARKKQSKTRPPPRLASEDHSHTTGLEAKSSSAEKGAVAQSTLMGFFKPIPKPYIPVPKVKPTVYRLVEETEEAEYYMPDYA